MNTQLAHLLQIGLILATGVTLLLTGHTDAGLTLIGGAVGSALPSGALASLTKRADGALK